MLRLSQTKLELERISGEKEAMAAEISSLTASRDEITATAKTEVRTQDKAGDQKTQSILKFAVTNIHSSVT